MNENYFADPREIARLVEEIVDIKIKYEKIIEGEAVYVSNLNGIIYPNNLFRASTTENRILSGIELTRNCFIYRKIDLREWRRESEYESKREGREKDKFNKYINFQSFIGKSEYYKKMIENKDREYIKEFYDLDKNKYS